MVELEDEATCVRFSPLLTAAGNMSLCSRYNILLLLIYNIHFNKERGEGEEQLESTSDLSGGKMQAGYQGCHII